MNQEMRETLMSLSFAAGSVGDHLVSTVRLMEMGDHERASVNFRDARKLAKEIAHTLNNMNKENDG